MNTITGYTDCADKNECYASSGDIRAVRGSISKPKISQPLPIANDLWYFRISWSSPAC
jgi:hypothetical protein